MASEGQVKIEIELDDSKAVDQAGKSGKQAGDAFAKGFDQGLKNAEKSLNKVGEAAEDSADIIGNAGADAGEEYGQGVSNGADDAKDSLSDVGDVAEDEASIVANAGQDGGEGFGEGVSNGAENAKDSLSGVGGEAEKAGSETSKAGQDGGEGLLNIAKKAAMAVASVEALTKVAEALGDALMSYGRYEQLVGGVETLFKESADVVQNYAKQAYETAGISANDYMEQVTSFSASLVQSLGGDTAKAAEYGNMAIIDMSDNANKMGTDIERIQDAYQGFAKQNFTMLDNLKLGYGGTKTEMERLLEDAEKIKAANGEMVEYSIDSFADMVEAIHVVQENMGIAGTTSFEAATTIEGSMNMVKAAAENLIVGFGDSAADLDGLIQQLLDSLITAAENIIPRLTIIVNRVASAFVEDIPRAMGEGLNSITSMLANLAGAIIAAIPMIISGVLQIGAQIIVAMASMVPQIISYISIHLADIISALIEGATAAILALVQALPDIITALIEVIPTIVLGITEALVECTPQLVEAFIILFFAFIEAIPEIIIAIVEAIPLIIEGIVEGLIENGPALKEGAMTFFQELPNAIAETAPLVLQFFGEMLMEVINNIIQWGAEMFANAQQAGSDFLNGVVEFITQLPGKIAQFLSNIISNVVSWVATMASNAMSAGSQFLSNVVSFITQLPGRIAGFLSSVISNVASFVSNFAAKALQAGQQFLTNIVSKVQEIPGKMLSIGGDIVRGIWNGISGAAGWLMNQISNFASNIVSGIAGFFGISSPSKVMRDKIGRYLPQGIMVGFEGEMPNTMKQIESTLQSGLIGMKLAVQQAEGAGSSYTTNNQTINFNRGVNSPDEIARTMRMQQRYGLAGSY